MDMVDAPYVPIKQRKGKTTFQQELDERMRQRRKQGLTHELTSEESEEHDAYDSEEEDSLTAQYRMQQSTQRRDRPSSAKRRTGSLADTITPKDSSRFMKKKTTEQTSTMPSLGKSSPTSDKSPRVTGQSEIDRMFGSTASPKSRKSPIEERYGLSRTSPSEDRYGKARTSPLDERFGKSRTSPVDSSLQENLSRSVHSTSPSLFPKTVGKGDKNSGDRKSPLTKEMSKEDLIFGRKTPTYEDGYKTMEKKEWKAPSFRKGSPSLEEKPPSPGPAEQGRGGRKTPMDLQPISENPKPAPRGYRQDRSPNEPRLKSRDNSPRSLSMESPRAEKRTKPKVDIFGTSKKEKEVDFDLEEEDRDKRFSSARARRQSPTSRQPAAKPGTDRQSRFTKQSTVSADRRTPTRLSDRKTPPIKDEREEREKPKKEVGLLDFLHDDKPQSTDREKPKPRLRKERPVEREASLKKSVSHDSITDELGADGDHPSMYEKSTVDTDIGGDASSYCAELDNDPNRQYEREKERAVRSASSSKQRSDRRQADDIINKVEDAQTDPKQFKERPISAKSSSKIVKPKPRHSLPGSVESDTSMDTFNSTTSIRQAIYDEWRKAKEVETKKKIAEQKKQEKQKEEKKKKDEQDKKLESTASYNAWMKQKEETFVKEQKKKKKDEEIKEQQKEQEKREKEKDALVNFKRWKERKDEMLVEEHKKKVEEKHKKLQETRSLKKEKENDNERAFIRWKERKDKVLVENDKKQKEELRNTYQKKVQQQRRKEQEAINEYNEWVKKKEEQIEKESQMKRIQRMREESADDDEKWLENILSAPRTRNTRNTNKNNHALDQRRNHHGNHDVDRKHSNNVADQKKSPHIDEKVLEDFVDQLDDNEINQLLKRFKESERSSFIGGGNGDYANRASSTTPAPPTPAPPLPPPSRPSWWPSFWSWPYGKRRRRFVSNYDDLIDEED